MNEFGEAHPRAGGSPSVRGRRAARGLRLGPARAGGARGARRRTEGLERLEIAYQPSRRDERATSASPSRRSPPPTRATRGYLLVFQNLTEIKRLEREVRTKEKLAAVGEMAAQLAHEIRNPLGSISGSAQVLMAEPNISSEQERLLAIITRESKRLSDTLNQFLYQARPSRGHAGPVDLGRLISEAVTLLRNGPEVGPAHTGRVRVRRGPHVCLADPDQITQVFWNLARNGLEAMPDGGTLADPASPCDGDDVRAVRAATRGAACAGEEQRRMFEPFQSGTPMGTGLGPGHRLPHRARAPRRHQPAQHPRAGHGGRGAPAPGGDGRHRLTQSRLPSVDARILAGLAVIPLLLFAEAVTGRRVFYERDVLGYWYSQAETIVRVMAQGSWPLWDPYEGFGRPLLAGPQAQLFYPFTWLDLLLPPAPAYAALVVAHTWLAAAGAYVLARVWGVSRAAAAVAAVALSCAGPFVSAASLFHHFAGAAWLPWVLAAFESFQRRRTTRSAVLLGIVGGLQILAGSGDMVVLAALSAALLLAGTLVRDGAAAISGRALARLSLAAAIALGLSAAQWVPALAVAASSNRSRMSRELNLYWSVHPASLTDLVVPQALPSLPLSEPVRAALFESREPFLPSLYLGLSTALLLVPLARFTDRRLTAIALIGCAFFLLAALGRHTPVLPVLLELPVISIFRYPVKYMLGAVVFWAAAAALGFEAWLRPWSEEHRRTAGRMVVAALVVAVVAIACAEALRIEAPRLGRWVNAPPDWRPLAYAPLVWKLRRAAAIAAVAALLLTIRRRAGLSRAAALGAAVLIAADMMMAARPVNELGAPELATYRPPALSLLPGPPDHHRLFVPTPPMALLNRSLVRGPAGWPQAWSWALGMEQTLQPPRGARWGLRGSYDADFTGMGSPAASSLAALVERYRNSPLGLRLLRMASVTEVVSVLRDPVPGVIPGRRADHRLQGPGPRRPRSRAASARVRRQPGHRRPRRRGLAGARGARFRSRHHRPSHGGWRRPTSGRGLPRRRPHPRSEAGPVGLVDRDERRRLSGGHGRQRARLAGGSGRSSRPGAHRQHALPRRFRPGGDAHRRHAIPAGPGGLGVGRVRHGRGRHPRCWSCRRGGRRRSVRDRSRAADDVDGRTRADAGGHAGEIRRQRVAARGVMERVTEIPNDGEAGLERMPGRLVQVRRPLHDDDGPAGLERVLRAPQDRALEPVDVDLRAGRCAAPPARGDARRA